MLDKLLPIAGYALRRPQTTQRITFGLLTCNKKNTKISIAKLCKLVESLIVLNLAEKSLNTFASD